MPKKQKTEVGSLSTSEKRKLQKYYSTGAAAYGSIRSLSEASKISESKVRQFLLSKASYTKYNQPARKFERLRALAKHINEIWCMDLAFVDKLASLNNGFRYLLVCVDVFSRFVRVQPMKTKDSKETLRAFLKMMKKDCKPEKIWVDKGTEFAGSFKKMCQKESISIYSTMSETKACYAERAIRSLKNIIYRYMEDNGYKYVHKLQDFVNTMNSRINRGTGMKPKSVKNSDVMKILYNKGMRKPTNVLFRVGDNVRISKTDIPFRKGYKPQFTDEIFEIQKISTRNPPTYKLIDMASEKILGKFYQNELKKVII